MQYIFHMGAHRTASTFLKHNLSCNLDSLRRQGIFYANEEMPDAVQKQRNTIRRLCHPARHTPEMTALACVNAEITRTAVEAGASTVLFSDENRLGPTMSQALSWGIDNPGFYPQAATCLQMLSAGLPAEQMRLLLYTRRPETYLLSLYSEGIRTAQTNLDLAGFCRSVNFNSIDFAGLQDRLQAVDPGFEIVTRAFERIKLGAETFFRTFLRDAGVDPTGFTVQKAPGRVQLDVNQIEALRQISVRGQSKRWRLVKKLREQVLDHDPDPAYRLDLPSWVRDSLTVTSEARQAHVA